MDGDYYSPTYGRVRILELASPDEYDHIIVTPNAKKLTKLTEEVFSRVAHSIHELIENEGVIVLDGIGKHSKSTESLLELADIIIVLCSAVFNVETDSEKCFYTIEENRLHPFDFYKGKRSKFIRIKTYYHNERKAIFDEGKLEGVLFDLDREMIRRGNIDKIPHESRDTILQIAEFILNRWV
jgi:hypothetical protein